MSAVLVISAILLLYGGFLVINLIQEEDNAISGPVTDIFARMTPIVTFDKDGTEKQCKTDSDKDQYIKWRRGVREGRLDISPTTEVKIEDKEAGSGS